MTPTRLPADTLERQWRLVIIKHRNVDPAKAKGEDTPLFATTPPEAA